MFRIVLCAVCLAILLVLPAGSADGYTEVRVEAFSMIGDPFDAEIELINLRKPQAPPLRYRSSRRLSIPSSLYLLRVRCPGFAIREELLDLWGQDVLVRIGLNVARQADEPPIRLRGHIVHEGPRPTNTWVKLVAILNNQRVMEAPVTLDGDFLFSYIAAGEYVLIVTDGDRLLTSQQISCYGEKTITIRVPARVGQKVRARRK